MSHEPEPLLLPANLMAETARLQREEDEEQEKLRRQKSELARLNYQYQAALGLTEAAEAQLAAAVARIAELGEENGRLFAQLTEMRTALERLAVRCARCGCDRSRHDTRCWLCMKCVEWEGLPGVDAVLATNRETV